MIETVYNNVECICC